MESDILLFMIHYFESDVRRINHALKVYGFARALSDGMEAPKREILLIAAILHDIGIRNAELKYNSSAGEYQELEGPPVAREVLEAKGAAPELIDRVCFLIGHHHSYSKIDGEDFQILVESDFLVNFYEDHLTPAIIRAITEKYFKTPDGVRIAKSLYVL